MNKFFFFLSLSFIGIQIVGAAEILCSLNQADTRYKLVFDSTGEGGREIIQVTMTASSISATRAGDQSQYLVGRQSFKIDLESDLFIMDQPILEGPSFDFTKVTFADAGPEDITVTVSGPVLSKDLVFTNCLTAE